MDSSGDEAPLRRTTVHEFGAWQRTGLGVAGVTLTVAGAVAVFVNDNGTGAAALVVGGLIALLLASVGRLARIKFGDAEVDMGAIEDLRFVRGDLREAALEDTLVGDDTRADELRAIADRIRRIESSLISADQAARPASLIAQEEIRSDSASERHDFRAAAQAFEQFVVAAATSAVESIGDARVTTEWKGTNRRWDVALATKQGDLLIDTAYMRSRGDGRQDRAMLQMRLRDRIGAAGAELALQEPVAVLLVLNVPIDEQELGRWSEWVAAVDRVEVIGVEATSDGAMRIEAAIQRLVSKL